jgi:Fic-DOC domain mobile mystery protein B
MYGDVWSWAGEFRKTNKNIGVDRLQIPTELKYLLDDAKYWHENNTFSSDEIAIRFKHRIVKIHCFPNGNGRHSRLLADVIVEKIYKLPVFSWGSTNLSADGAVRAAYLKAVKAADLGEYAFLLAFARS